MTNRQIISSLFIFLLIFIISSCKEDNNVEIDNFNQTELLKNIGENIIINNYETLNDDFNSLNEKKNVFFSNPTNENFDELKTSFIKSYKDFQTVSMFDFGPANESFFRLNANAYPTDTIKVKNALNSGNYNLSNITNNDMKGLSALDYLLSGVKQNKNEIIEFYSTDPNAVNHQKLMSDII